MEDSHHTVDQGKRRVGRPGDKRKKITGGWPMVKMWEQHWTACPKKGKIKNKPQGDNHQGRSSQGQQAEEG
jgi:hypothetical protein